MKTVVYICDVLETIILPVILQYYQIQKNQIKRVSELY